VEGSLLAGALLLIATFALAGIFKPGGMGGAVASPTDVVPSDVAPTDGGQTDAAATQGPIGISQADAVAIATTYAPLGATFKDATSGPLGGLVPIDRVTIDPQDADKQVWAIRFDAMFTICSPDGACRTPRAGTSTVLLDFVTGAFIRTDSYSPGS